MKTTYTKVLLMLFLSAFAFQKSKAQSMDISLNILPIAFNNYSLNYMYNIQDNMSAGGVIGYQKFEVSATAGTATEKISYNAFYIAPEFRAYFNPDNGNDGIFGGAYLKYRNGGTSGNAYSGLDADGTYKDYDEKLNGLAAGVILGRLWATDFGLTISTWSGFGYYLFDKKSYTNGFNPDPTFTIDTDITKIDFRLGLNIGWRIGG